MLPEEPLLEEPVEDPVEDPPEEPLEEPVEDPFPLDPPIPLELPTDPSCEPPLLLLLLLDPLPFPLDWPHADNGELAIAAVPNKRTLMDFIEIRMHPSGRPREMGKNPTQARRYWVAFGVCTDVPAGSSVVNHDHTSSGVQVHGHEAEQVLGGVAHEL